MILNGLFDQELKSINIGLVSFQEALKDAGCRCIQVDWSPPAGGDEDVMAALAALGL